MQIVLLIGMLAFVYLVFLRPQQKRLNQQKSLVSSVEVGDEVVTAGGIVGQVIDLDEEYMTLEVCPDVEIKFLKIALSRKISSSQDFPTQSSDPKDEEVIEANFDDEHLPSEVESDPKDEIVELNPTIDPEHKEP